MLPLVGSVYMGVKDGAGGRERGRTQDGKKEPNG